MSVLDIIDNSKQDVESLLEKTLENITTSTGDLPSRDL